MKTNLKTEVVEKKVDLKKNKSMKTKYLYEFQVISKKSINYLDKLKKNCIL